MINKIYMGVLVVILILISLIIVDCSCGTTRYLECVVVSHNYVASYITSDVITDGNGNVTVNTTYYPEEFHVWCEYQDTGLNIDVMTSSMIYNTTTNGQSVTVKTRQGKWSKSQYIPRISL